MTEAPDTHPKPRDWWWHVFAMGYIGMAGLLVEAVLSWLTGGEPGGGAVIRSIAWAALAATPGAASTLIDSLKAWRGHDA